jgi:NtrC-family two-component system response regulator AlgB
MIYTPTPRPENPSEAIGRVSHDPSNGGTTAGTPLSILVVDDEKNIRTTLSVCLSGLGHRVGEASSAQAAMACLSCLDYDVVFLDLQLGATSGLDLLPRILAANVNVSVVMITAYATFANAVEAVRRGAQDYLPKPFTPAQIEHVLGRLVKEHQLRRRVLDLESRLGEATPEVDLDTRSPKMRAVLETARKAAETDATVLLRGENGTGKGVLARAIHEMSPRRSRPFVVVNCPSLSEELMTSELFGHVQGAFTGALRDRVGRVEAAQGGTLFLDEIAELTLALQTKLLRFLQEKAFERVGESQPRHADVRVVVATNRNLEVDVKEGRFREDLLFRLNVIEITLPPLRERTEDVLPLAHRFLNFCARQARRPTPEFSKSVEELLQSYGWPGNLRELRNAIERAMILWPARVFEPEAFPERIVPRPAAGRQVGGPWTLDEIEDEHIERVVAQSPTLDEASRILGIDPSTLWRKRKKQAR